MDEFDLFLEANGINYKDEDTNIIIKELYKIVAQALQKNDTKFRANIANFINYRHELLFAIAPYDRIYYNQTDVDLMFKSLGITEENVKSIMKKCFFFNVPGYNPQCAKEPYVMTLMMCIRYYLKNNKRKYAELTSIYLAFSGKFYASLHAGAAFPTAPPSANKPVMDYVINNMLTDKYDLKREGTVFGAVQSLCITWINTYENSDKWSLTSDKTTDDELGKLVQQLRDRERSFLMNIAKLYYEAYNNKSYLNYETDNLDEDNFRLTNNDAATAARLTENTMSYITSNYVSLEICNKCKDENIKATEIKDIMETIIGNNDNLPSIRRVINIIICDFMVNNPKEKVGSINFVAYTMQAKPNTKVPHLIELKQTILTWLDENSPTYRKRKSRLGTQNSYYKSVLMYFTLIINKIAR